MDMVRKQIGLLGAIMLFLFSISLSLVSPALAADAVTPAQTPTVAPVLVSQFKDVPSTEANAIYVNYLASKEIIKGYPDGGFHPDEGLTRAQAATIIVKAAGLKVDPQLPMPFSDVPQSHWAKDYIAAASKAGYLSGYPDQSFHPDEKISRAQGISLTLRLSKEPLKGAELPKLSDIDSKHWAAPAVAVGLASGMVGLSPDGKQYLPDAAFTRINLAHALGLLLTEDPGLNTTSLPGKIKSIIGTVKIKSGSGSEQEIKNESNVNAGEIIITGANSSCELSYPDGSSMLIKENTEISVKEAKGRIYIKTDGSESIAVDWLNLVLKKGTMFGALATKSEGQSEEKTTSPSESKKTGQLYQINDQFIASLNGWDLLAADEEAQPWWKVSQTKKVKVKVDMPWGVAAIRGTFVMINVSPTGQSTISCLIGSAEVTNGGQTVPLTQGLGTQLTTSTAPPAATVALTREQVQAFQSVLAWIETTAQTMEINQAAAPPPPPIAEVPTAVAPTNPVVPVPAAPVLPTAPPVTTPSLTSILSSALTSASQTAASAPAAVTTTQPTSSTSSHITLGSWSLTTVASVVYEAETVVLTQDFYVTKPSALGATQYQLLIKDSGTYYRTLSAMTPVGQYSRQLAKIFESPGNIIVKFFNDTSGQIGMYQLAGNGLLENLATKTISGTITLPEGKVAPIGGIRLSLYASGQDIGGYNNNRQSLVIPAGASSLSYSIPVADNIETGKYKINYFIYEAYAEPYVRFGFYENPVNVIDGSKSNIDLAIVLGKTISGQINLPSPNNSSKTKYIEIKVDKIIGASTAYSVGTGYPISTGQSSAQFTWVVEPGDYKIGYTISDRQFCGENNYLSYGFYNQSGTVINENDSTLITVSTADIPNVDMTILTGYTITGTVSLPAGHTAPTGGVGVSVSTYNSNGNYYYGFGTIAAGNSSASYSIAVPPGTYTLNFYTSINTYNSTSYFFNNNDIGGVTVINSNVDGPNITLKMDAQTNPSMGPEAANSFPAIDPAGIDNNTLLVGRFAFNLNSPAFTSSSLANLLCPKVSLYYKSPTGQWFDLQAASNGSYLTNSANATTPPPIYYIMNGQLMFNVANDNLYYPAQTDIPWRFTVSPPDAGVGICNSNPTMASLSIPSSRDEGRIWGRLVTGSTTGTTQITMTATAGASSCDNSPLPKVISVNVVPYLNISPKTIDFGYATTPMTVLESVYAQNLWSSGDPVTLELVDLFSGAIVANSFIQSLVVNNNDISFNLAPGLKHSVYGIKAIKNSAVIGMSIFAVEPAGNQAFILGATYSSTSRLAVKMQWVESGSTFDLSKLTFRTGSGGSRQLTGTYTLHPKYDEGPLVAGEYSRMNVNGELLIWLTDADKTAIESLVSGLGIGGVTSLDAAAGWNTDASNNAAAADGGNVVTVTIPT